MIKRRVTRPVHVGNVQVGGGSDITVQSMTKTDTRDVKATVRQIHAVSYTHLTLPTTPYV